MNTDGYATNDVTVNIILTGPGGSVEPGTIEKVLDDQYNLWISQLTVTMPTLDWKQPWYKRLLNWMARK